MTPQGRRNVATTLNHPIAPLHSNSIPWSIAFSWSIICHFVWHDHQHNFFSRIFVCNQFIDCFGFSIIFIWNWFFGAWRWSHLPWWLFCILDAVTFGCFGIVVICVVTAAVSAGDVAILGRRDCERVPPPKLTTKKCKLVHQFHVVPIPWLVQPSFLFSWC